MPITPDQIVAETRDMPSDVVVELVDRIMLQLHGAIEPSVEKAWSNEIHRRVDEIKSGKVKGIPGEEVSKEIRKIVGL